MLRPITTWLAALATTLALSCAPVDPLADEAPPGPHRPDLPTGGCGMPEYDWLPTEEMGQILDWERLPEVSLSAESFDALLELVGLSELGPVPYGTRVYRIRYLTQDRGEPYEATGLLAFPDVQEVADFPVMGVMHPTLGYSDACAASVADFEVQVGLTLFAALGYAVVVPDFIGMSGMGAPSGRLHPYIVPEPTAVSALDGIRALYAFQEGGHDRRRLGRGTDQIVLWGASQGGFAALWADRYAGGYAPELEIQAVIAAVPPTDMLGLAEAALSDYIDATESLVAVLASSWDWYRGELHAPLSDVFVEPVASEVMESLVSDCGGGWVTDGASQVQDLFTAELLDAVHSGDFASIYPFGCYAEHGTLVHSAIPRRGAAPVLFQVAERDELVVGAVERVSAGTLCDAGYTLDYLECAGVDHVSGVFDALPLHVRWLQDRLRGEPVEQTCLISEPVDCRAYGG